MLDEIPTHDDVENLLVYLPLFDKPGRPFVKQWAGGEKTAKRSFNISYPVYEQDVEDFFQLASQPCWNDTNYNPETAGRMLEDEPALLTVNIEGIRTMLTFCVRGERFCDGHWEMVLKSGKVVALLRRLQQIQASQSVL